MQPAFLLKSLLAALSLTLASRGTSAESAEELIRNGDVFYTNLQATEALKFYLPAEKLEPKNVRLLVRIAREYRHQMSDDTKAGEKLELGNTALDYARSGRWHFAPNDPEAHLAMAISYGKLLPFEETRQKIVYSRLIKIEVDKVIAVDPNNDLAWQVLGQWYLALADIGSIKAAPSRGWLMKNSHPRNMRMRCAASRKPLP